MTASSVSETFSSRPARASRSMAYRWAQPDQQPTTRRSPLSAKSRLQMKGGRPGRPSDGTL
eukprot:2074973-Prymnesium_polylepis.1